MADSTRLVEMGRAAREYVEREHAPSKAAAAVVDACRDLSELEPPGARVATLPEPTTLTFHSVAGEIQVEGAQLPWQRGEERQLEIQLKNQGIARWLAGSYGSGGVILETQWRAGTIVLDSERVWIDLPHDLSQGDSVALSLRIRRPLSDADSLLIEPHVLGIGGFGAMKGPYFAQTVENEEVESA